MLPPPYGLSFGLSLYLSLSCKRVYIFPLYRYQIKIENFKNEIKHFFYQKFTFLTLPCLYDRDPYLAYKDHCWACKDPYLAYKDHCWAYTCSCPCHKDPCVVCKDHGACRDRCDDDGHYLKIFQH